MKCVKCEKERGKEFYQKDKTCKECRKAAVRKNRKDKIDYYTTYEKSRAKLPHRVKAREDYAKTPKGKKAGNRAKKAWEERNAIKKGAATMVGNAVRDGIIKKGIYCEECGDNHIRLHGHHDDYAYPLDVRWLCPPCHKQWHTKTAKVKTLNKF